MGKTCTTHCGGRDQTLNIKDGGLATLKCGGASVIDIGAKALCIAAYGVGLAISTTSYSLNDYEDPTLNIRSVPWSGSEDGLRGW